MPKPKLLGTTDQSPTDFSFVYNGEPAKTVTNVPVQQNYITNIKGQYSSLSNFTFDISADDIWSTPDLEPIVPNTVKNAIKGKLKEAVEAAGLQTSDTLIIQGPVNEKDLLYINQQLTALQCLDLRVLRSGEKQA